MGSQQLSRADTPASGLEPGDRFEVVWEGAGAGERLRLPRVFGPGTPISVHPVIVRHPVSGKKLIYVNTDFTSHINELPREEGDRILKFLYDHCARDEWVFRFRWRPHSIFVMAVRESPTSSPSFACVSFPSRAARMRRPSSSLKVSGIITLIL